jgi:hypothetical protein
MFNPKKKAQKKIDEQTRRKGGEPNLSKSQVSIVVKRLMGGRVPVTVASFTAKQTRQSDFNLQLEDAEHNFKEDITFSKAQIIETLQYKLDFGTKTTIDKIKLVKDKIVAQEQRLKSIDKGVLIENVVKEGKTTELKIKVNLIDEENNLKFYKVLLECVENEGDGSYEEIRKDGMKQITFLYDEGVLYPYFWNVTKHTLYPDRGTKRKVHKPEQDLIDKEFMEETKSPFGGFAKSLMWALFVILFIGNFVWTAKNMSYNDDLNERWNEIEAEAKECTIECANYISQNAKSNAEVIAYAIEKRAEEDALNSEKLKNSQGIVDLG